MTEPIDYQVELESLETDIDKAVSDSQRLRTGRFAESERFAAARELGKRGVEIFAKLQQIKSAIDDGTATVDQARFDRVVTKLYNEVFGVAKF